MLLILFAIPSSLFSIMWFIQETPSIILKLSFSNMLLHQTPCFSNNGNSIKQKPLSTTVWLHHIDLNKVLKEKVWWELHKDDACFFEYILEATPYKIVVVWWLTSHLTDYPSKVGWRSKDELMSDVLLWTFTHGHTSISQPTKTYIDQPCQTLRAILRTYKIDWDGWQETVKGICAVITP